jgi:hypothetical protein
MAQGIISGNSNVTKGYVDEKVGSGIIRVVPIEEDDFYDQLSAQTLEDSFYKIDYKGSSLVKYGTSQTTNFYAGATDSMRVQNGVIYMGAATYDNTMATDYNKISCIDTATNTETVFDPGIQSTWGTNCMAQSDDGTIYIPTSSYTSGTTSGAYKNMVVVHDGTISVMELPIFETTGDNPTVFWGHWRSHVVHGNSVYFFAAYIHGAHKTQPILKASTDSGSVEFSYIDLTAFPITAAPQWGCDTYDAVSPSYAANFSLIKYVLVRSDGMYIGRSNTNSFLYLNFSDDSVTQVELPSSLSFSRGGTFMSSDGHLFVGSTASSNQTLVEYDTVNLVNTFSLPIPFYFDNTFSHSNLKCGGGTTEKAVYCLTYAITGGASPSKKILKIQGTTYETIDDSWTECSSACVLALETSKYLVFRPQYTSSFSKTWIVNKDTGNVSVFNANQIKHIDTTGCGVMTKSNLEFDGDDSYCVMHSYTSPSSTKSYIVMGKINDNEIQVVGDQVPAWDFAPDGDAMFAYKFKKKDTAQNDKYYIALVTRDTTFGSGSVFSESGNSRIRYIYTADEFGFSYDEINFPFASDHYFMSDQGNIYLSKMARSYENGLYYLSTNTPKTRLDFVANNKVINSFGEI